MFICYITSYTESITEDLDVMQPVGYESEKFSEMIMTFDRQSSQAANDALQLLKTSSEMHDGYESQEGKNSRYVINEQQVLFF